MLVSRIADLLSAGPAIAFLSVLAGSLGIPVPTVAALVFVGSLIARSGFGLELGAESAGGAMIGAVIGDVLWFSVGRRYGAKALRLLCRFSLSRDTCVRSTADFFSRRGLNTLLIARFVPGLSVLATPMAGASGVSFSRFIAYAASGDAIWIGTCLFVGYGLADQIGTLLHMLRHFGLDLGGVAMTVILAYVGLRWYSRQRLVRRLRMARISADELAALMSEHVAPVIMDVRSAGQKKEDPYIIAGSMSFDLDGPAPVDFPKDRPMVIYCSCPNEVSAAVVARRLHRLGFRNVRPLLGGIDAWRRSGRPVESIISPRDRSAPAALAFPADFAAGTVAGQGR